MGYPYRCSKQGCRKWVSLRKRIEDYVRKKKCPVCKNDSLKSRVESERKRNKIRACYCDGWHWSIKGGPHKKGSAPWCIHSKRMPTEEEIIERHG